MLTGDLEEVPSWLACLESRVRQYLLGEQDAIFSAAEFGLDIPRAKPQERKALPGCVAQSCLDIRIIAEVRSIVMAWLRYPTRNMSRVRGTFVRVLLSTVGDSSALLLPGVQDAFLNPYARLFEDTVSNTDIRKGDPALLDGLGEALAAMAVAQHGSLERKLLVSMGENVYKGRECIRKLLHPSFGGRHARVEIDDAVVETCLASAIDSMVSFLDELYLVLILGNAPTMDIQAKALEDPDFYSPFRQLAPQVLKVSNPNGFLHPTMINMDGAIASLWSWRGVFYRSQYSKSDDYRMFFRSAVEWEQHRIQLESRAGGTLSANYFCTLQAYGTASANRSPSNIPRYFQMEKEWREVLSALPAGQTKLDYRTAFKFTQEQRRLPGVGRLTGMLVTSDLVYAGIVQMPTEEELGLLISHLSMGALSAVMEFLPIPYGMNVGHEMVRDFFVRLYRGVRDGLDDEKRAHMQYDPIMFEHALCKYQRLGRRAGRPSA